MALELPRIALAFDYGNRNGQVIGIVVNFASDYRALKRRAVAKRGAHGPSWKKFFFPLDSNEVPSSVSLRFLRPLASETAQGDYWTYHR
jgi:hypothetical protein